jgi:ribosomal protein S9
MTSMGAGVHLCPDMNIPPNAPTEAQRSVVAQGWRDTKIPRVYLNQSQLKVIINIRQLVVCRYKAYENSQNIFLDQRFPLLIVKATSNSYGVKHSCRPSQNSGQNCSKKILDKICFK